MENGVREAVKQFPFCTDLLLKETGHISEANRGEKSTCAFDSNGKQRGTLEKLKLIFMPRIIHFRYEDTIFQAVMT